VDLSDDQKLLLAKIVERYPDHINSLFRPHMAITLFSGVLHWERNKTETIYNSLKVSGAIKAIGPQDCVTDDGMYAAVATLNALHQKEQAAAIQHEKRRKRREIYIALFTGVLGGLIALLVAYLVHFLNWNK
jgi:hypothetical protein